VGKKKKTMGNINQKVYIIHGWTYSTEAWDACIRELQFLKTNPEILHVPGLTQTSDRSWTLDEYVAWLHEIIADSKAADIAQEIILICHSNGGRIALAYAAKYPHEITKLILIDAAGIVHNEAGLRLRRRLFGAVAKTGKKFTSNKTLRKILYRIIGTKDYERASEPMRKTMAHLIAQDLTPGLSKITVPTLIIWGEKDDATPLSDAEVMHKNIKNSKLIVIPNTGHSPHKTHPKEVALEISKFI
jgi:pimeloyl-ACP methyl ester carboxylesterase